MYNAADEEKVEESKTEHDNRRSNEVNDIRLILSTAEGERFFARFFREARIFHTTFRCDGLEGAFLEGHRNLALRFFDDATKAAPNVAANIMINRKGL